MENQKDKNKTSCSLTIGILIVLLSIVSCVHRNITKTETQIRMDSTAVTNAQGTMKTDSMAMVQSKETMKVTDTVSLDSLVKYTTEEFNPVIDSAGNFKGTYLKKRTTLEKESKKRQMTVTDKLKLDTGTVAKKTEQESKIENKVSKKSTEKSQVKNKSETKPSISVTLIIIFLLLIIAAAIFLYVKYRKKISIFKKF